MSFSEDEDRSLVDRFNEYGLLNQFGVPRLNLAYYYFANNLDLKLLVELYEYWRDKSEYGVLEKSWFEDYTIKHEYKALKCSKRGNDVYLYRLEKRLGWTDKIENEVFFTDKDIKNNKAFSRLLLGTLSYSAKRCSRAEAWANIGKEYNNWIRAIRQKYGKVSVLRTWQTYESGYPHVHAILLFQDYKFKVSFLTFSKKTGQPQYRISEKEEFESCWHSFVDVEAVTSIRGALHYAKRYITRAIESSGSEHEITPLDMALMWLFHKRAYAISGDFRTALHEFIQDLHNSDNKVLVQMALDGSSIPELEVWYRWGGVHGVTELEKYGLHSNRWVDLLDNSVEELFLYENFS